MVLKGFPGPIFLGRDALGLFFEDPSPTFNKKTPFLDFDGFEVLSLVFRNRTNPATMSIDLKKRQGLPLRIYFGGTPFIFRKKSLLP
jgi:hypothetical protein